MNRSLLITLFGLALAIGLASSFNDDEDLANIAAMKEATNDYDLEDAVRYDKYYTYGEATKNLLSNMPSYFNTIRESFGFIFLHTLNQSNI